MISWTEKQAKTAGFRLYFPLNIESCLCRRLLVFFIAIGLWLMASDSHAGQNSPTIEVMVNQHKLSVELVATPQTRAIGLSGRKSMPENHGMLFVYRKEKLLSFWMHNTTLPLSIAFLNSGGIILNILDMEPLNTIPRYSSVKPAQFALETNQGWFERQGIRAGDRVHFDIPGSALVD